MSPANTGTLWNVLSVTVPTDAVANKLSPDTGTTCDVNTVTGPTVPVPAIPVTATFGAVPIILGSVTPPVAATPVGVTSIPTPPSLRYGRFPDRFVLAGAGF